MESLRSCGVLLLLALLMRFNPSYEMESLRSVGFYIHVDCFLKVSILLMKWNPYEVLELEFIDQAAFEFQSFL